MPDALPVQRRPGGVVLAVRLTPKAASDLIGGVELFDGAPVLKVRVRALPAEGEANAALCRLIAKWLKLPCSVVSMESGRKSRLKRLLIAGEPEELAKRIEAALAR